MPLLLTILSVLIGWALLAALVVGLLLVLKGLQGTRTYMEKIAMGVRAIEKQAEPLERHAQHLEGRLAQGAEALEAAAGGLRAAAGPLRRAGRSRPRR